MGACSRASLCQRRRTLHTTSHETWTCVQTWPLRALSPHPMRLAVPCPALPRPQVRPIKPNTDPINSTQVYIIVVSLLTVAAWCGNSVLQR